MKLCCIVLFVYHIIFHYIILYYIHFYYIVLYYIILYYFICTHSGSWLHSLFPGGQVTAPEPMDLVPNEPPPAWRMACASKHNTSVTSCSLCQRWRIGHCSMWPMKAVWQESCEHEPRCCSPRLWTMTVEPWGSAIRGEWSSPDSAGSLVDDCTRIVSWFTGVYSGLIWPMMEIPKKNSQ